MNAYLDFVSKFPKTLIVILIAITIYFGYMTGYLTEDSNPYLIPESHPARSSLLEIRENFTGTYDSIMVGIYNPDTVFNRETLAAIFHLTQVSRQLTFVNDEDITRIEGLINKYPNQPLLIDSLKQVLADGLTQQDARTVRELVKRKGQLSLSALDFKYLRVVAERLDPIRELAGPSATENVFLEDDGILRAKITLDHDDHRPSDIRKAMTNNELMDDGIISPDEKVALIVVEISILQDDAEGQLRAYDKFHHIIAEYQAAHPGFKDELYVGGVPAFFAEQKKIMDRDMANLLPAVILLVSIVLAIFFRSFIGVIIPLVNVIMCTIWTFGAMAILDIPIDMITAILPVFLITICSSDAIHVMAEYYHQRKIQKDNRTAVKMTMKLMTSPVVLTTLTTCVTFLVSTTTSISNLRNFGISMSFGMFVAMIISLILIPAWLVLLKDKQLEKVVQKQQAENYYISKFLIKILNPMITHRQPVVVIFTILLAALLYIGTKVRIDDMGSGYFAEGNSYRVADDFINAHVAGTSPGWIEIDTGTRDGALTVDMVNFIDRLEKFIHTQDNVSFSYSIARYIRRINYVLNDMNPDYNRLPEAVEQFEDYDEELNETFSVEVLGNDIVRQSVLLYENGGGSDLTNVLSPDFSKTVLLYTMTSTVASDYQAFLDQVKPWLEKNTPTGVSYKLAGTPIIWTTVLDELISGQLLSIFLAFGCVITMMAFWLKSLRMGIIGTLPLAVTVIFYYAIMSIFDIELNIGTAIISFLVLGVVDYSVHYLLRTKHGLEQGLKLDQALHNAIIHSGRSIIANVFVFSIGFVALLLSEFKPIVDLGSLVGLSLLISGIMSIFVITLLAPWLIPTHKITIRQTSLQMG